jgi:3-deoxy-D-manno-octulosonic-acid transferase
VRLLYNLAAYLLAPLYCGALLWRGLTERGYREHFAERFGLGARLDGNSLWVHAASAGEVQAALGLVRSLRTRAPHVPIVVTTVTAAGAARARAALAADGVGVRYLPLDLPGCVRRFLDRVQPRLAVFLETEIWPNLYGECRRRGVPVVLASARLSPRSARRYLRLRALFAHALAAIDLIAAQTDADAERFRAVGARADGTRVVGNLKFDFSLPADLTARGREVRARLGAARPMWVAGSTHAGEERAALQAHAQVRGIHRDALLVLAPRHPQRFDEVAASIERSGVRCARRSRGETPAEATEVLLVDTLGELLDFYAASDVVFVGGSLVPIGGHNLLEPAALAKPILTGPHNFAGAEIARQLLEHGAAEIVHDADELGRRATALLSDPALRARMGQQGVAVVEANRGALARLLALIEPLLRAGRL